MNDTARETLFISDLHLSPDQPQITDLFLRFLRQRACRAERLYILGDLFDAWIGDDDDHPPHPRIIGGLRALADAGTGVYIQRGNRDFLLGRRFARASGCTLLGDPALLDLYGQRTLLMHGDLLCTDDIPYQKFRRKARNPLLQWLFLLRGLNKRRAMAAAYRRRSQQATAEKTESIMDVNPHTVADYLHRFGAHTLIHGHTHRPGRHEFALDGHTATRWVLSDWHPEQAQVLVADAGGIRIEQVD